MMIDSVLEWLDENDYFVLDVLNFIKITNTGKLHKSLGFYFQHSKEVLILATKVQKTCFNEVLNMGSAVNTLIRYKSIPSGKTKHVHLVLHNLIKNKKGDFVDIYSRNNNVSDKWIHVSNELTESHIKSVFVSKTDIKDKDGFANDQDNECHFDGKEDKKRF